MTALLRIDDGRHDPLGVNRVLVAAVRHDDASLHEGLDDPLERRVRKFPTASRNDAGLERVTEPARTALRARATQREDHEHITMGRIESGERIRHEMP